MMIYELKNGKKLEVRRAEEKDSGEIVNASTKMGGESDNLTFGKDDFYFTEGQEREFISEVRYKDNCLFIVALLDGSIIGDLTFISSSRKRMNHRGEIGIGILKDYWGIGIGTCLMDYFFKWAYSNGTIKKVELTVREDNINAINLYIKWGFKIEGRVSRGINVSGKFYDLYTMGKIIG